MRLYLAGSDGVDRYTKLLIQQGAQNRLESYYSLANKQPSLVFSNLLIDSGGFVARTRNIIIDIHDYANYLNKYNIKLAFNLDTNNVAQTLRNQDYLIKHTKAYIIPIYHMSDWLQHDYLIDKFIADGFPYIGLGGTANVNIKKDGQQAFYNHVFARTRDKVKIHGLGMTTRPLLEKYPFFSVDSTSWLSSARYGNSISKDKVMIQMKAKKRHYLDNTYEEIDRWLRVEKDITALWNKRGIIWNDNNSMI